jgi:galactitol-specific phosphotransferase system IIB component
VARKIKIAAVCMAGMGSGFLFKMAVEEVAKKLGYPVDVEVVDSGGVSGMNVDFYVTTPLLAKGLSVPQGKRIVTVPSFTNKVQIEEALGPTLREFAEDLQLTGK